MDIYRCLHKPLDERLGEFAGGVIVTRRMASVEPNTSFLLFTRHSEKLGMLRSDIGPCVGGPWHTEEYLIVKGVISPARVLTNA
jgi:hypothetical protein